MGTGVSPGQLHIRSRVFNSDGPSPGWETGSSVCPTQLFSFINLIFPGALAVGSRQRQELGPGPHEAQHPQPTKQGARGHKLALPTTPSSPLLSSGNFGELIPSN